MTRPGHTSTTIFNVGSASEEYLLTVAGFTGEGSDQFAYHGEMKFTTPDNNNNNDFL